MMKIETLGSLKYNLPDKLYQVRALLQPPQSLPRQLSRISARSSSEMTKGKN